MDKVIVSAGIGEHRREKDRLKYTQGDEQEHILAACAGIENGRFLDIGAWNAKELSNTRALYELGWSGVLVEPSPGPFKGLVQEYGNEQRIKLVCGAVGLDAGNLAYIHASDDALSTTEHGNFKVWERAGGFYGSFYTPIISPFKLWVEFGPFDMLSIDTEGTSVNIFEALLSPAEIRPRCIAVEHDCPDISQRRTAAIAEAAGYRRVYEDGNNEVWAR